MLAPDDLLQLFRTRLPSMLESLSVLVGHESPSRDKAALDGLASLIESRFRALGGHVTRLPNPAGGDHIRAAFGSPSCDHSPLLILTHYDTVWPLGTLARMPFRVEGDRAHGPGIYDMKASQVLVESALSIYGVAARDLNRGVVVLATSDEEIGSPTSRGLIEAEARHAGAVLVMEPPLRDGRLKTARKGVGRYELKAHGRPAHAGVEPEKGRSAIVELAHQILALNGLARPELGTTVNVGVISGGTTTNVVPAEADAQVDVRVSTLAEANRIDAAIRALSPATPDVTLTVSGGINRPPMERTEAVAGLFGRVREVGRVFGWDLGEGSTGGGSDGNFTAGLGIPTIDGLGAMGDGAHADHEHILISSLPERAALLAALLAAL